MKVLFFLILTIYSFLIQIFYGLPALQAISFLSRGEWLKKLKDEHLKVTKFLIFMPFITLLFIPFTKYYPWIGKKGIWFNPYFFVIRNFLLLLISYYFALVFKRKIRGQNAHLYLLSFVLSQSLFAFDLILSLEYPFYSTLYGAYFFIESVYISLCLNHFYLIKMEDKEILYKNSSMIFGFSLMWAGLFFAQYLVIWYGNLPEETHFLIRRTSEFPFNFLSPFIILFSFLIPFPALAPKSSKLNKKLLNFFSLLIILGLFIERVVIIFPAIFK
ncbi:MAG: hypothetical protein ABIM85_00315 [candidate division WOR-3 bacterium]